MSLSFMSSAGVVTHCLSVWLMLIVCQMQGNAQDSTLWQLSPEELEAYDELMDSGGEVVFIAPRPGTLRIIPDGLSKAGSQTPSTAYLRVARASGTDTTTVVRYFSCSGSYNQSVFNTCDSTQFSVPIYWHEQFFPPSCPVYRPRDTLYVGPVATGDTLRFSYHAELDNSTMQIYLAAESLWAVSMWTPVANQCLQPRYALEGCFLLMGYADTLVKIRRPDSVNVYPTYPGYNQQPGKRNYLDLELSVEFANSVVPNYWVKVDKPLLADSGGHSHDGTRPMGRYVYPITSTDTFQILTKQTDSKFGKLRFRYVASQFGGVERITAKLLSDTTSSDTLSLITRVRPVYDFATISSNFWDLVGNVGVTFYHRCPNTAIKHYSNHWFEQTEIDSLQAAILDFFVWSGTVDGGGEYLKLGVNDMSLIYGGLFDICSTWQPGHFYHRTGNSVDFNTSAVRFFGGSSIALSPDQRDMLTSFMAQYGGVKYPEEPIHYGFGGK